MHYVKPKKSLGQHFLTDKNIARKIVNSLHASDSSTLLEIGPGMGILSQFLKEKKDIDFKMIEIDAESADYLAGCFPELKDKIIQQDFLRLPLDQFKKPIAVIGNFPYNISSQIFFRILEHRNEITEVAGMVQKEVAQRIAASPGNKTYGILSVLLQAYYEVKILFSVKPHVFSPPPKVQSAVIRMVRKKRSKPGCDEELFFRVVKMAFNQRRKIIRNALQTILLNLEAEEEIFYKRPEQLTIDDFARLTRIIEKEQ